MTTAEYHDSLRAERTRLHNLINAKRDSGMQTTDAEWAAAQRRIAQINKQLRPARGW